MCAKSGGFHEKRPIDQQPAEILLARYRGNRKPLLGKPLCLADELPLSPVGKVLRRLVKERYWKGNQRAVN
jgi:acyl-CoA synthetase (AMP-forming)/AMP-acid ligase II